MGSKYQNEVKKKYFQSLRRIIRKDEKGDLVVKTGTLTSDRGGYDCRTRSTGGKNDPPPNGAHPPAPGGEKHPPNGDDVGNHQLLGLVHTPT